MATSPSISAKCVILLIKGYQYFISPLLGPSCRFHPTCSHYALEAITRFGFFKGGYLSVKRILKCQPLHEGGYDPVMPKHVSQTSNQQCSKYSNTEQSKSRSE